LLRDRYCAVDEYRRSRQIGSWPWMKNRKRKAVKD